MNLSNIKEKMNPIYFNHWLNLANTDELTEEKKNFHIQIAYKKLSSEMEAKILVGPEYEAEKKLLERLMVKSFEIKKGKWTEAKFDPNKKQVPLYEKSNFFNNEGQKIMINYGIGQY